MITPKPIAIAFVAVMTVGLATPAYAMKNPNSPPHSCNRNPVTNSDPSSGTNGATLGITTKVNSTEANTSEPPVMPNTPANTNSIDSNNPGAHAKLKYCSGWRNAYHHRQQSGDPGHP